MGFLNKIIMKGMLFLVVVIVMSGSAWALSTSGTPIIAIDGNTDGNVTVDILSTGGTGAYTYGYFLNGSSTFSLIGLVSVATFQGGDIIDFALYDGSRYYTLSGDNADSSYSALMTFVNEVTVGSPQQPAWWSNPYYYNANITWILPTIVNTNELALNFVNNGNDGIAPVPEPGTLILLGSGLLGFGAMGLRRKK